MANPEVNKFLDSSTYGQGTFLGDDPSIFDLSKEDQLTVFAWRHACPRPGEVSKNFGLEWTRQRYAECNFVFGVIVEHVKNKGEQKSSLLKALTSSTERLPGEPVGVFEEGRVPETHKSLKSLLSKLVGYALPRVFIELAGRENERTWDRYDQAFNLLDKSIKDSNTPEELLARLAETVYSVQIEKIDKEGNTYKEPLINFQKDEISAKESNKALKSVLSHVLEPGILTEENNVTEYRQVALELSNHAPKLYDYYWNLTEEEKKEAGIFC